jgi:hypothetical protein
MTSSDPVGNVRLDAVAGFGGGAVLSSGLVSWRRRR